MSNVAASGQDDTTVIPLAPADPGYAAPPPLGGYPAGSLPGSGYPSGPAGSSPGGQPLGPNPIATPQAAAYQPDAAGHWYAQYQKQRRRARFFGLSTALLAVVTMLLAGTAWALYQSNDLSSRVAAALPGVSGVIGAPQPQATPEVPGDQAPTAAPTPDGAADLSGDLAELQQLAQGLKNDDGSLNPLAVAGLAGKLGSLAQDPQRLNSLIDQAQAQGIIDSQVAGLLRGVLAGAATSNGGGGSASGETAPDSGTSGTAG